MEIDSAPSLFLFKRLWVEGRLRLFAKREVAKHEELTIDYVKELPHLEALQRRELLRQDFGFECRCGHCEKGLKTFEESGGRRCCGTTCSPSRRAVSSGGSKETCSGSREEILRL